jgi:hypothetical protein
MGTQRFDIIALSNHAVIEAIHEPMLSHSVLGAVLRLAQSRDEDPR